MSLKKAECKYENVWVFVEVSMGQIVPVVIELLGEGRKIADKLYQKLCAVLLGDDLDSIPQTLISYGADIVYTVNDKYLKNYTTDGYTSVICNLIEEMNPEIMLFGATQLGGDLAPRIAARVNTGLTADCTILEIDEQTKNLNQTKPAFDGNLMATIVCPNHRPQMSTIRPGVMDKAVKDNSRKGEIIKLGCNINSSGIRTELIEVVSKKIEKVSLSDANVIVAGGMGLGGPEGFELLKKLADKLGGTIAATKAAVDEGWIEHSYQIGQTGMTVKPEIYIACGISGAVQHISGMHESKTIIAINKNKEAPIFDIADYGLVGDYKEVVPYLIENINK